MDATGVSVSVIHDVCEGSGIAKELVATVQGLVAACQDLMYHVDTQDLAGVVASLHSAVIGAARALSDVDTSDAVKVGSWVTTSVALNFRPSGLRRARVQGLVYLACVSLFGAVSLGMLRPGVVPGPRPDDSVESTIPDVSPSLPSRTPTRKLTASGCGDMSGQWTRFPEIGCDLMDSAAMTSLSELRPTSSQLDSWEHMVAELSDTISRELDACHGLVCREALSQSPKLLGDTLTMQDIICAVPSLQLAGKSWPRAFYLACRWLQCVEATGRPCDVTVPTRVIESGLRLFRVIRGLRTRMAGIVRNFLAHEELSIRSAFQALLSSAGDPTSSIEQYLLQLFGQPLPEVTVARFHLPMSALRRAAPNEGSEKQAEEDITDVFQLVRGRRYAAATERQARTRAAQLLDSGNSAPSRSMTAWAGSAGYSHSSATTELSREEVSRLQASDVGDGLLLERGDDGRGTELEAMFTQQVTAYPEAGRATHAKRARNRHFGGEKPDSGQFSAIDFVAGAPSASSDVSVVLDGGLGSSLMPPNWKERVR
jgi:hypothetical protein